MSSVRVWGADAGDFLGGKIIWSALNALRPAKSAAPSEVDLSDLLLVRPYAVTAIAALGCLGKRRARLIIPQTQDSRDYVIRSEVAAFFDGDDRGALSPSPRVVPVRQLLTPSSTFADEVTMVWEREFGGLPPGLRPRLANHLDEMIRNALAHSGSSIGCIVAGQAYPKRREVEIAVLDVGDTIMGHLTRNPLYATIRNDEEAVMTATEEGVSGTIAGMPNRLGEPNSGIGLYELRHYCQGGGGELTVLSGSAMITFSGDRPVHHPFAGGFPGCLINMRFRVNPGG